MTQSLGQRKDNPSRCTSIEANEITFVLTGIELNFENTSRTLETVTAVIYVLHVEPVGVKRSHWKPTTCVYIAPTKACGPAVVANGRPHTFLNPIETRQIATNIPCSDFGYPSIG